MSDLSFDVSATAKLTTTLASQTITLPGNGGEVLFENTGPNIVYFAIGATAAVPAVGSFVQGLIAVAPGLQRVFTIPAGDIQLSYIAETAGGTVIVSVGIGG